MTSYDITRFGAIGDGRTDNSRAIAEAIEQCSMEGGGTVRIPPGVFRTGPIHLRSAINLQVDAGAILSFIPAFERYEPVRTRWSGYECYGYSPLIYGSDLDRISITGKGVIDGSGSDWWDAYRRLKAGEAVESPHREALHARNRLLSESPYPPAMAEWDSQLLRPPLIGLIDCKNVVIEDVTLSNSPFWNTHLIYCEGVRIRGASFRNPADAPNGDGLDIDSCRDVTVTECLFDVGDDCVCLKSGIDEDGRRVGRPTENVVIANCTMKNGHGGVVMGSETAGGIRHVAVANCLFVGTDRGIRMKTNRVRGGYIEKIQFHNILMEDVLCPIAINSFYRFGLEGRDAALAGDLPTAVTDGTPVIRHIAINGLTARGARAAAGFICGLPEMPIEELSLSHVTIEMTSDQSEEGGEPDMVDPPLLMAGEGMYIRDACHVVLHQVRVETRQGPGLRLVRVEEEQIDGFTMRRHHAGTEAITRGVEGA
ncbi:glycoside hydrolase [Paenibacillus sp. CCS19]|uniref:glycoside hydrolase family 28 protein n=1 Tax=Paenibacillus sp. CCS19 TaxID=3158387 RepID=UPI00256311D5|nr:glycoside hydrolase family 28 protein [Paenibacillus cellulosilyticus]GMK38037.1 glycoside hydrolase [Paenibacillus cellulosilyticus]